MKQAIKEAIEFLIEYSHWDLNIPANEGYISLAEAVSEVLDNSGIPHNYNSNFINQVEKARKDIILNKGGEVIE